MAAPDPTATTCVSDTTPVCDRIALLERIANQGAASPAIGALASRVSRSAEPLFFVSPVRTGDWRQRILGLQALREVQSLPYVPESTPRDCYQPVEKTLTQGGECKALTTTLVALLRRLGIPAQVEWIMQPGRPLNHVSSLAWIDGQWFWADASIRGAMFGESPYHALQRTGAYHVVGGQPQDVPGMSGAGAPSGGGGHGGGSHGGDGGRGGRFPGGVPFGWPGWSSLWWGWPWQWWSRYYPYFYSVEYYPSVYPACYRYNNILYCPIEEP